MSDPMMTGTAGEFDLIDWIRERDRRASAWTVLGIGDDCAILRLGAGRPTSWSRPTC